VKLTMHPDRLFPSDNVIREIARRLYSQVKDLPIISPHGHTDPRWFAENKPFENPTALLIQPDHYLLRMLYSQGISMESLGIRRRDGGGAENSEIRVEQDPRKIWRLFAEHYYLFRGTPTRMWLDYVFSEVFGLTDALDGSTADSYFDHIDQMLKQPEFLPRALFERFNIEVLATTESPLDDLRHHQAILDTAFRPDPVLDPEHDGFIENVSKLGELTGEDTQTYSGYLAALRERRRYFKAMGATSTDHGHPSAVTADLSRAEVERLYAGALKSELTAEQAEMFRGQMLTEMAIMSLDDGLVMQIHPGCHRNHNSDLFNHFGRDKGADLPVATEYISALKPLLNKLGNDPRLSIIVFTLDESSYSRELAPLAGHYPALKVGPAWWFHDSPEGMRRYREQITETAGFYNTVGFNDDTRAFLSIPARHDVARRMDCAFLAQLVAEHRLSEEEAAETAIDLSYRLAKNAYKL
jgi:glucuronate isomerase